MMRVAERLSGLFHSAAALATRPAAVAWTPTTSVLRTPQAVLTSQQVTRLHVLWLKPFDACAA